ncbi:hypothetical protein F5Y11DRAFT_65225 [Daldinia sp. FL1419]|nr:hypothetical protein F5Y11DRAFT_65225 [Daldinia sp. FL1419]
MATPGTTQALLAAFFFGILFNAASAGLVLYAVGHGSAIFRDGLRLVLILFLTSSAAWALVEFLATIIEPIAASTCQVAVVFSSIFDQMARVFVEQYLVWAARPEKKSIPNMVSQVLVLGRFGVGMAFIGLARSDFNPTCVPVSSVPPVAIIVIVLDALILALVAVQALSNASMHNDRASVGRRSVTLVTVGFAIWIGTSVVLLLGAKTTNLALKTTLPTVGLAILVASVTVFSGSLVAPRDPPPRRPDSPTARDIGRNRDLSSSDSTDYPPSRYEDVKGVNATAMAAYVTRNDTSRNPGFGNSKKNIKGKAWNKAAAGGKLVISKPVLIAQEGMENPLDRITTVDLATAANNEKERRDKLQQPESTLIAQRPAPRPPTAPERDELLARELSLKRKQVGSSSLAQLERSISTKTSKTIAGLSVEANASSTSSELSPGAEQVRRRSPRHPPAPPISSTFQPILPGEPVRIPIPRPRDPSPSPKEPEPVKTPLQRRPTTGLPSNPRAQAMKSVVREAGNRRQETVMFINNIVYDDPNFVSNIVQGASKTPITSLDSSDSVVNRPRPIPRKGDNDRQVFPAEVSPTQGHRRAKSSGSIIARKSMLQSVPGNPTQLPPLPPLPNSAGNLSRLQPIHVKSMSLDEKMDLLYPTPLSAPSASASRNSQKSTVPEMPPLPAAYIKDTKDSQVENAQASTRLSKTTDKSSTRTASILGIDDIQQQSVQKIGSSQNAVEELGQSWLPGVSAEDERKPLPSHKKMNRRSSPVIPEDVHFNGVSPKGEGREREGYVSTIWGSVHSPIVAVNIQQSRQNAHSTYIQKDSRGFGKEKEHGSFAGVLDEDMTGEFVEYNKALPKVPTVEQVKLGGFHHRVGEECPAFSTRKGKGRLRKILPPAPLVLNGRSNKRTILVQPAEPSPLESPRAAYEMIQAQLQRFEQPNLESVDSGVQRLALLENLEREMGQLENQWQSSQKLLQRDSISSIKTSPAKDSRPTSTIAERRASRNVPSRIGMTRSKGEGNMGTPSSQNSSQLRAHPADGQIKNAETTPSFIMKQNNLNFLSVSTAALGSPSPPDTEESECEGDIPIGIKPLGPILSTVVQIHHLWKPQPPAQSLSSTGLWAGVTRQPQMDITSLELRSLPSRPTIRKAWAPLAIESSRLWEKTLESSKVGAENGLWQKYTPPQKPEAGRTVARPVTVRPPRRNKRVSLLPDILENPEPLPEKRGTLGLFQFPWGEKSESASIQLPPPTRMYTAMPGTMTTGAPATSIFPNSRTSQEDDNEFTTSFFDDYEAEEEGDNFDSFDDFIDSDGEDFDENTLWEIASLLRSGSEVTSRDSLLLFAQQRSPSIKSPSYVDDIDVIVDGYNDDDAAVEEPIPVEQFRKPTSELVPPQAMLWTPGPKPLVSRVFGLPQPDLATWESYKTELTGRAKSNRRIEEATLIQSVKSWEPRTEGANFSTGLLWNARKAIRDLDVPSQIAKVVAQSAFLWVQPSNTPASEAQGLFDISDPRKDYRRTSREPAALFMKKQPRVVELPLEKLMSKTLWGASHVSVARAPLLWENSAMVTVSEHDGLFDSKKFRLDYRRTDKEPAAISIKIASRVAREPLASLQTKSLWTKESASQPARGAELFSSKMSMKKSSQPIEKEVAPKSHTAPLWEKSEMGPDSGYEGLFNVSVVRYDYRRTSKAPAAITVPKKFRPYKEPLPSITTTGLWSKNAPAQIAKSLVSSKITQPTQVNLLWERPNSSAVVLDHEGLFAVNVVRVDYRRTSKLPAAINMTQKPRKMVKTLPTLISTKLWEKPAKSSYTCAKVSLWSQPLTAVTLVSGLFQLDPARKVYRTTSAEPAALQVNQKPRLTNTPLPVIKSTRLWSGLTTSVELDWMTISSVRPRSPSVASVSTVDSLPASPVTDSPSVKTSLTKASSAKSSGSVLNGWLGNRGKESETPKVPELPQEFIIKNLDEQPQRKASPTPLRQLYRPSIAYRAAWDAALREAIIASFPGSMDALRASYPQNWDMELQEAIKTSHVSPQITRRAASPRDWSNALHVAIISSYPEIRFSRGQALPSQWNTTLQEAIARGQPPQPTQLDVTIRHPVFMGSLDATVEIVRPAVGPKSLERKDSSKKQSKGPVAPDTVSTPLLWEKPVEKMGPVSSSLWSYKPKAKGPSHPETGIDAARYNLRKSKKTSQDSAVDIKAGFGEQGMWRRGNDGNSGERDWLEDSMKKRFTRVELRY